MTITTATEITEITPREIRLQILEAQICQTRDDIAYASTCGDIQYGLLAMENLATLVQHTVQELAYSIGR